MGPWNTPWLTFLAFVVTDVSILIAVIWAIIDWKRDGEVAGPLA